MIKRPTASIGSTVDLKFTREKCFECANFENAGTSIVLSSNGHKTTYYKCVFILKN